MKKTCLAVLLATLLTGCAKAQEPFQDVGPAEAAALLKDPAVFLLDVRTPPENATARIAGDTLAPVQTLEQQLNLLPKDKTRPVLIYCRSGNRSAAAARILAKHGRTNLHNLAGGMIGWQKAGLPIESGPRETASPVVK
ncbi:MAG: rhodanese-like domain-containing protein [Elusimicrobia bacterium]|jgi:rhodanese-related sulfurtransferase|nr:rhodanese-like domain-containing protein [Elusimicrobiota bacterium]MBK7545297.1 rhodanese-like domain-containing protein [Elusimicrobiota bacterium]MBK7575686.1 rhodanese-like domain-containing protein [Elusimicrobiota bacterium]MBK8126983.1 rhodanese-like domain-containing protein [Elusimicrobiota bacterium]MBK8423781.1 rhodanese-like domain-containing protein [Elusimicrobiota bacterium]